MDKFDWESGTIEENAYVEINGNKYYLHPPVVSGGTPVTDTNLNDMQDILNQNMITTYSTSEVKTNEVWIDDSPIYIKGFVINASTLTTITQALALSNINNFWIDVSNSYVVATNGVVLPLGHYATSTDWSRIYLLGDNAYITFGTTYSTISKTIYLVIRYTKSS